MLYGRAWCHLCEEMQEALNPLQAEIGFHLEYVDVDSDPALEVRFGELVPVLMAGDRELCHYSLDPGAVRDHFRKIR